MYRLNYQDYMRTINEFLIKSRVNEYLCKRAADLMRFRWEYNENTTIFGM